ncbi:hypothetical protein Srot_0487 [Segniliparus rotundus DSM 44985]|uniref:Lipoprotein n=1 Tax=Segniliparus rotundus (strain ATCC BAA-972 / CDC 1076 / CIP 108378 / DSM 44985 / JCM 13578) TaxID=640132 RepID=D6ZBZ7_SEGRD|nr:hypothetical protein [Segniliparus rotundus]ADG96974.1 hypothetical protein Srot_0487 [Segniliparus rotundus DSM 44985]
MRRPVLIALLSLCLVVSGCGKHERGNGSHNVTYEITGVGVSGKIKISYLSHMGRPKAGKKIPSRRSSDYAAVPYTKEVTLGDFWDHANIHANDPGTNDNTASLTCTIKHDGAVIATKTGTRSVTCEAPKSATAESN